jgi:hypothetical protein
VCYLEEEEEEKKKLLVLWKLTNWDVIFDVWFADYELVGMWMS